MSIALDSFATQQAAVVCRSPPSFGIEQHQPQHPLQHVITFTVNALCGFVCESEGRRCSSPVVVSSATRHRLGQYVERLLDMSECPSECMPVALAYLRTISVNAAHVITRENVCLLFSVALVLASKWLEDITLCISSWERITSYDRSVLIATERDMLAALQWQVYVNEEEYLNFVKFGRPLRRAC